MCYTYYLLTGFYYFILTDSLTDFILANWLTDRRTG
jgi:hypothetical protein